MSNSKPTKPVTMVRNQDNTVSVLVEISDATLKKLLERAKEEGKTFDEIVQSALNNQIEHFKLNGHFEAVVKAIEALPTGTVFKINEIISSAVGKVNKLKALQTRLKSYLPGKRIAEYDPENRSYTRLDPEAKKALENKRGKARTGGQLEVAIKTNEPLPLSAAAEEK